MLDYHTYDFVVINESSKAMGQLLEEMCEFRQLYNQCNSISFKIKFHSIRIIWTQSWIMGGNYSTLP